MTYDSENGVAAKSDKERYGAPLKLQMTVNKDQEEENGNMSPKVETSFLYQNGDIYLRSRKRCQVFEEISEFGIFCTVDVWPYSDSILR